MCLVDRARRVPERRSLLRSRDGTLGMWMFGTICGCTAEQFLSKCSP